MLSSFDNPFALLLGFWLPIFVIGVLLLTLWYFQHRQRLRYEERRFREEMYLRERQTYTYQNENPRELREMLSTYLDANLSRSLEVMSSRLLTETERLRNELKASLERGSSNNSNSTDYLKRINDRLDDVSQMLLANQPEKGSHNAAVDPTPNVRLVREISHALNTPLSQIEVVTEAILADPDVERSSRARNLVSQIQF